MNYVYKQNDDVAAYVKEYVVDTPADIETLPTNEKDIFPGSTAIVTSTSDVYMLSANHTWVKL